jgi:SAM-dependent methyltransferase
MSRRPLDLFTSMYIVRILTLPSPLSRCVGCGASGFVPVLAVPKIPRHHFMPRTRTKSGGDFGELDIVSCKACGHLYNRRFDDRGTESLYAAPIQTNIPVSPAMTGALESTAAVILSHARASPTVLEVGGGAGHLSRLLSTRADKVHFVEPSQAITGDAFPEANIVFHRAMFPTPSLRDQRFDVVVCRQVLEHVSNPIPFLRALRASLRDDGMAYIEIPSAEYIVANSSIIDFHYAHVHYYRRSVVEALFSRAGFAVSDTVDVKLGHDIGFVLKPADPVERSVPPNDGVSDLAASLDARRQCAHERLNAIRGPIVLYGANSYSQALFGLYPGIDSYGCMFDDTPQYSGHLAYGPLQDLSIEPPNAKRLQSAAAVVITAYLHDQSIAQKVRALQYAGPIYTVRSDNCAGNRQVPDSLFR